MLLCRKFKCDWRSHQAYNTTSKWRYRSLRAFSNKRVNSLLTSPPQESSTTGDGRVDEQLELLSERITGLVSEAERLGSEGNVEEAQGLLKLCDQLREERDALRRSSENSVWHQVRLR